VYEDNIPFPKQKILEQRKKGAKGIIGFVNDLKIDPYSILCSVDRATLYVLFQMKPTRCTLLLSIISTSLHVSGNYVPIIRRNLLYLCDTHIFHSVWVENTSVAWIQ